MIDLKKHLCSNAWSIGFVIFFLIIIQMFFGNLLPKMGFMPFVGKCLLYALIVLAADLLVYIIYNLMHIFGVLVGGMMTGYKFLSFQFLIMDLSRREGKLSFLFRSTSNNVVLGLPVKDYNDKVPYFWVNSTSIILRGVATVVAIFMIFSSPFNFSDYLALFVKCVLILFSFGVVKELFLDLFSLFTKRYRKLAVIGDILTVRLLSREPEQRKIYTQMFQINTLLYEGKLMRDMPEQLFDDIPLDDNYTFFIIINRVMYITRLLDLGQYELAQQAVDADKISFVKNYSYTGIYIHSKLYVEFYNNRRPEKLKPFCKDIIMLSLRLSKLYGLLYAFYRVCMLDDYEAQKAKSNYESYIFSTFQDETTEANMIAFIDSLKERCELPEKPIANLSDFPPITYHPVRVLFRLLLTPLIAYSIHASFLSEDRTIDKAEQEYADMVKHEMIWALNVNNCESIKMALLHDEEFRKKYPNSILIDYDYLGLVSLCENHLEELDCDNNESNDN